MNAVTAMNEDLHVKKLSEAISFEILVYKNQSKVP
jgi:hypothetical protein